MGELTIKALDELQAAHEQATPGEWRVITRPWIGFSYGVAANERLRDVAFCSSSLASGGIKENDEANATAIALSHNMLPGLIEMSRRTLAAEARAERCEATVQQTQGVHIDWVHEERKQRERAKKAESAAARRLGHIRTLLEVEWLDHSTGAFCPWCGGREPKHADDCARQTIARELEGT